MTADRGCYNADRGCYTGCQKKEHMIRCYHCGADYHIGTIHDFPTGVNF